MKGEFIMFLLQAASTTAGELSEAFVVAMGMGTVFVGLICIILLTKLMSLIINGVVKEDRAKPAVQAAPAAAPAPAPVSAEIPNRAEFVAAVSAAIAEDLGTDISKIQIVSIKRI